MKVFRKRSLMALAATLLLFLGLLSPLLPIRQAQSMSANLAIGKSYTASSSYNSSGSFGKGYAADGDPNTAWRHLSTDTAPWWEIDLGAATNFNLLILNEYQRNCVYEIQSYKIEYSNDNTTWTTFITESGASGNRTVIGSNKRFDIPGGLTARYIKLSILGHTSTDPSAVAGLNEFQIYQAPTNLTYNKSASASSTYNSTSSGIAKANDGDPGTYWQFTSSDTSRWWKVDLGSSQTVSELVMDEHLRSNKFHIWHYKVESSNDNATWSPVYEGGQQGMPSTAMGANKTVDISPVTARYFRLTILDFDKTDTVTAINEFTLYNGVYNTGTTITADGSNQVGQAPTYVGFSATNLVEGSNQGAWLKYGNVNAIRYWVTPARFIKGTDLRTDAVSTVADFDSIRSQLRNAPETNGSIIWTTITPRFSSYVDTSNVYYTVDAAFQQFQSLGIEPMVELNQTSWVKGDWSNYWDNWRKIYAVAYYLAKTYRVHIFQTANEPDLSSTSPLYDTDMLDEAIRLYGDAVHSAVQDASRDYYPSNPIPNGILAAPVLAGSSNTAFDQKMLQNIRVDYEGTATTVNNVDWYDRHRYSPDASEYPYRVSVIRQVMNDFLPSGVSSLPITFSEWNWHTAGDWSHHTETSDTPVVFTSTAQSAANLAACGAKGIYQFKFEATASQNGNFVNLEYPGEKDPNLDMAFNKPATASSEQTGFEASHATDGDIADTSMWKSSATATSPQWLQVDLQGTHTLKSAWIENGTDSGLNVNTNVTGELNLQYWDGANWNDIPGASMSNAGGTQLINFSTPVTTSKVRAYYATTTGEIQARELSFYEDYQHYDIGGPMKTAEVARLFAEGFKNDNPMYATTLTGTVNEGTLAYTSLDPATGNYYFWLDRQGDAGKNVTLNLSGLSVSAGQKVTVKEVSERHFGDVVQETTVPTSKLLSLGDQPSSSVWLVTILAGSPTTTTLTSTADARVKLGTFAGSNYGSETTLLVRNSHQTVGNNSIAYIKFDTGTIDPANVKQAILKLYGQKSDSSNSGQLPLYVYLLDDDSWTENGITGSNAPNLNPNGGFAIDVGSTAWPVGVLSYGPTGEYMGIDITKYVKEHPDHTLTFMVVREPRYPRADELRDAEYVTLTSREGTNPPSLVVRY